MVCRGCEVVRGDVPLCQGCEGIRGDVPRL